MITFLKPLRCVFGYHGDLLRDQQVLRCADCFQAVPILASEIIKGPAHGEQIVRGKPNTRTFQEAKLSLLHPKRRA